ncbi:hypothetical protein BEI60_30220 [Eisenbergiella tayi]|nr:hypothetical protein BEI60_30220 [Eisenbergiella tayi]
MTGRNAKKSSKIKRCGSYDERTISADTGKGRRSNRKYKYYNRKEFFRMKENYEVTVNEVVAMVNEMLMDENITPVQLRQTGSVLLQAGEMLMQASNNRFRFFY